jgi:tRNA (adenine22-N1)-methyltransferase
MEVFTLMELSPRLKAVAELVPRGARLADIGTDHAYLPVWLLLEGRIPSAIAADLREGPLARAQETAVRCSVADRVSFRLCDGLTAVGPDEADTIAIAGMGGETIASILAAAPWTRDRQLLLQPMTSFPDLRLWLQRNGYRIQQERICREGERLYSIWNVTGGKMEALSPAELWAGRQSDDPLRGDYLALIRGKVERTLAGQRAAQQPDEAAIAALTEVLHGIQAMEGELAR